MVSAVYDGNYLLHRCMRAGDLAQLRNRHGKPTGGLMGFLKSLQKTISTFNVGRCVVVFDAGISPRRRALYPPYKGAKYRSRDSEFYEEPDEDKKQHYSDLRQQTNFLKHALGLLGVRVVKIPGWEADDLCYRIAKRFNADPGSVLLVSDDRDYLQAVHSWKEEDQYGSLSVVRPIADEHVTLENFEMIMGHRIGQHLLWRAIEGDGSDKIRGIDGVGKGWLRKIFRAYDGPTGYPFEDFILWCSDHNTKTVRKISDSFEILHRNFELMDFESEPYPPEVETAVLQHLGKRVEVDLPGVKYFLSEMDLFSIVNKLHKWVVPFQRLR